MIFTNLIFLLNLFDQVFSEIKKKFLQLKVELIKIRNNQINYKIKSYLN